MGTVYLDELLLLNLLVDYFLLLGTAKVCALPYHRERFLAGAALGAVWCCMGLLPALGWLDAPVMRLVLAAAMVLISFGGERHLLRCLAAFLGVTALFGGAVYAAGLLRGGETPRLDMRVLALAFALCWAAVSLLYRGGVKKARRRILNVTVERNGKAVALRALEDTGNGLVDPVTGCAALVADPAALRELFDADLAPLLTGEPAQAVLRIPGTRLLPYAGLDGNGRMLLAFRPDRITVDGEQRHDLVAAVAPAPIGTDGAYDAVL